ncbi:MAG: hypothetical protein HQL35_14840 [Alphaproteobacteria bacterium]|nr:hypothetical protein [Alphaproteobacteria bacterium]
MSAWVWGYRFERHGRGFVLTRMSAPRTGKNGAAPVAGVTVVAICLGPDGDGQRGMCA